MTTLSESNHPAAKTTEQCAWDGVDLDALFKRALEKGTADHPIVLALRKFYPNTWKRISEEHHANSVRKS